MPDAITREEVERHDGAEGGGYWVVIEGYVVDLTSFLDAHPAGAGKIVARRRGSVDVTSSFVDHFGRTVRSFRDACRRFDETGRSVAIAFRETAGGGGEARIVGRVRC